MKAYQLTIYEYNTFTYDGLKENETFVHLSENGAIKRAEAMKLKIVSENLQGIDPDHEATIEEIEIYE